MNIGELSYVIVGATDLEAWRQYGSQVLGMQPVDVGNGSLYLRMDRRDFRVLIEPSDRDYYATSGWSAPDRKSFEAVRAQLIAAGVAVTPGIEAERRVRKVQEFFKFQDPSGASHEVSWGPISSFSKFVSPTGTRFVTGELGMGHTVLPASDMPAQLAFWTEVMGFGISDVLHLNVPGYAPIEIYFLHCAAGRQHSLALASIPQPSGCVHLMFEVDSVDEVGLAMDRVGESRYDIVTSLGRHVNDDMISFYMSCPGGFEIEYGAGGAVKDWANYATFESTRPSHWGHHRTAAFKSTV